MQFLDAMRSAHLAIRPLASFTPQPWRNDGGTTRLLAENIDDAGSWRISLADVALDGHYSRFADMTRVSLVVDGAGVTLDSGSARIELLPARAAAYDGDADWRASLHNGPVMKLNAMVTRGRYSACIVPVFAERHVPSDCFALLLTLHGATVVLPTKQDAASKASTTLAEAHVATRNASGAAFDLSPAQREADDASDSSTPSKEHRPYAALVLIRSTTHG
ncbi:environmental stress-induced protein Ves [Paraburkholderia sp. JPY465]|uniref:HutD/Ves family protein n=2 Tax=unclassified Paraburkholderia TaxID=2615204 RepID=UPI003D1CD561